VSTVIVVTSGKGGVGKTTTSASIATGLALKGHKVVVIDFDVGLRNLDLMMGCERAIVHDFINVVQGEVDIQHALIQDKRIKNLFILASSQTRDKDNLSKEGVGLAINALKKQGFNYIICDSPAGIEKAVQLSLYYADEAIIVTNAEISSVRDADRILGILQHNSKRADDGLSPIKEHLVLTRYQPERVKEGDMLSVDKVIDLLSIPLLGVVPEAKEALPAVNSGTPIILNKTADASLAYQDIVERILGGSREQRFITLPRKSIFRRIFGK